MEHAMSDLPDHTNRLVNETSPYLRQHAHNPVDWYAWGPEALERSRALDRPIFLSIGYSACHWCHVMEHESFEDPEVARLLNENFVSIKVDREERPDLDQIYMTAVQMLAGQGGWPMSVWLTPDLEPFYGGTYFPPDDRYGRPSFKKVLQALREAWHSRREEITASAAQITAHLQTASGLPPSVGELGPQLLRNAAAAMERIFDSTYGGFGQAPKFPHPMELRLLLRTWKRFSDEDALNMAKRTLDLMARGGIYDHLGGGFHRYSTDAHWLVPHFEKMLYDNALLAISYLEAYQATGESLYRQIVDQTLGYVLREMRSPDGPFYSTQDADSEGEEGKFFVWSLEEVEEVLGKEPAEIFTYVFDVTAGGNWEGHNILHRTKSDEQDARMLRIPVEKLRELLAESAKKLYEVRERRVKPGRDEKILASWNGLMIDAFALASGVLGDHAYADAAMKAADFILRLMRTSDGRLFRTYSVGTRPKLNGCLEDYAFLLNSLVTLYESTFDARWIDDAIALADVMVEEFWDEEEGGFYFTGRRHERLLTRTKDPHDSSVPSGNSMAVTALLRLAKLSGRTDFATKAERTLRLFGGLMNSSPLAAGQMLLALDFYLGPVQEFAIVGDRAANETRLALDLVRRPFRPNKVVAFRSSRADGAPHTSIPLLEGKSARGPVTTYICRDFICQDPLVGVEALECALKG
jgi:uncharacterized protein YyaL (SSP411 family)